MKFKLFLDPCFQPVGISNGLVKRIGSNDHRDFGYDGARFVTPFTRGCNSLNYFYGYFGTSMTIKGIAMRSKSNGIVMELMHAFIDADPWMRLRKSSRIDATTKRVSF